MRQTIKTENAYKTGDYVVSYDIEEEMERDKRKQDREFL